MKAKVFVSHAASDVFLASQLAEQVERAGLEVLNPYDDIVPGENWAEKVARDLEESDFLLIVITGRSSHAPREDRCARSWSSP